MLLKYDVILVMSLIVFGCYVGNGHGKYMSQCEFVHEFMKYSPQVGRDDLNKWTCIAQYQSNFNASKRHVDADGSTYHGMFQISDQFWCSRVPSDVRVCNLPCIKLEDSYYGDDFQCVQKIHADHLRIFGNGFSAWPTYSVHCTAPKDYASECLDKKGVQKDNVFLNRAHATAMATAKVNKDRTLERKMHKIYERCELARELFYVHDVPFEQVATWVCIAKHESNFNTSAIGQLNADGSGDHGIFQISDIYWCSPPGKGWVCGISCAKLENADITDDVECMRKIYAEHQRLSGDGFNAWSVYPRCKGSAEQFIEGCFDGDQNAVIPKPAIFAPFPAVKETPQTKGKKYDRCELARELRFKHNLPRDQIHTWVCIAKHESSFDTSAVGRLNADGSGDHGLFQISDIYWCSVDGTTKACGVPCTKFEDSDISDDVQCIQRIHEEHQRLFGNGFRAWTVYEPHCKHQTVEYIRDCFEDESDVSNSINAPPPAVPSNAIRTQGTQNSPPKVYQRCELAQELRYKHNMPKNQIHTWLCIAKQLSGLDTSSVVSGSHGLFHISDQFWCSNDATEKGCALRCSDLTDGDIADDVRCARIIFDEHQRLYGNGFHAWTPYETQCRYETAQLTRDCFDDEPTSNVHQSVVPVKVASVPNAAKGKVYESCELAKELRYKHNIPRDQIADWVCVALFQSNFVTSAVSQAEHGIFQISDAYWCSLWGSGKGCGLPCSSLEDSDITDDVQCAQKIHSEHQRLTGNGFSAWATYEPYCKGKSAQYIQNCFTDEIGPPSPTQKIVPVTSRPSTAVLGKKKVYERCELARELRFKHNLPRDQIHTWVCIAKHESSFDTSAVGRLNADGSGDHGLFQISDIYWCSVDGTTKACGVPCSKFEDSDISDDVQCVQRIHEEHQRLFGNGFHAWTVYEPHCRHQTVEYIRGCFDDESDVSNAIIPPALSQPTINLPKQEGKAYERCELAKELRYKHQVPIDEIADWVCIAQYQSNLVTSARGQREHGLFQISNEFWCSLDGQSAEKGCNLNCAKLEDNDIGDDIACARKIHAQHQKISGNGFTAWATYEPYCRGRSAQLVQTCFPDKTPTFTMTARPTVPVSPKHPATSIVQSAGKIYAHCDLAKELRYVHNVPLNEIHTWICIAQQQSRLNTSAIGAPYAVGNRGFGIFQISEAFWCQGDAENGANVCGVSCSNLLDDKLADDVQCARQIYNEHQRLHGNGFHAWNSYETYCKYQTSDEVTGCFAGNEGIPTPVTRPPVAAMIAQSYAPKQKVRDRCTIARDLRFKQNIAADKLSMWLCIAEHEPSFDESNMVAMNKIYDLQRRLTGDGFEAWDAYEKKCKRQVVVASVDECFGVTTKSTTRVPFIGTSATSKPTTKSPAASLFAFYLNQFSTSKPQLYNIPTHPTAAPAPKQLNTNKIPNFPLSTTTTARTIPTNDHFRSFANSPFTKLTGSSSNSQPIFLPIKPFTTTQSPYAWASFTRKPSSSTTTKPFPWSSTTRTAIATSAPHTYRYTSGTTKRSLVTTKNPLHPFTWKSTV